MFERYLAEALAIHFGQFIEDFDADKVKISVWNGEVVLKDLKLKRDAFQRLLDRSGSSTNSSTSSSTESDRDCNENDDTTRTGNNVHVDQATNDNDSPGNNHSSDQRYGHNDGEGQEEEENELFPCQISYGHIGTFELHIPWTLLRSSQIGSLDSKGWSMWSRGGASGNSSSCHYGGKANNDKNVKSSHGKHHSKEGGCSIALSDVNILINPGKTPSSSSSSKQKSSYSQEDINNRIQKDRILKERQVQKILDEALFRKNIDFASEQRQQQIQQQEDTSTMSQRSQLFVRNLIQNIVSSLSITVRNVHIRYEDPGDCLGFDTRIGLDEKRGLRYRPPFAIGITLKEFTVYSTTHGPLSDDELYSVPDMSDDEEEEANKSNLEQQPSIEGVLYTVQHKMAASKALSIYWDSDLPVNRMIHMSANKRMQNRRRERQLMSEFNQMDIEQEEERAESIQRNLPNQQQQHQSRKNFSDFNHFDDEEEENESNEFYANMLQQMIDIPKDQELHQSSYRTYIIEPISPSLHFSVVNALPIEQISLDITPTEHQIPPSRAVLTLPPFQTNLSKDTLEDIGYLRRSFVLWKDMKHSLLTRKVYMKFIKLRPKITPVEDAKSWWRYAFEAVKILSNLKHEKHVSHYRRKQKGWLGLSNTLQLQKKYIDLYEKFLEEDPKCVDSKNSLSQEISSLEDRLDVNEIVAFRVTLIMRQLSQIRKLNQSQWNMPTGSQLSSWSNWISPWSQSQPDSSPDRDGLFIGNTKEYRFFSDDEFLSPEHRESIIYEITNALGMDENENFYSLIENVYHRRASANAGLKFLESNIGSGSKLEILIICPQVTLQADNVAVEKIQRLQYGESDFMRIRRHRPIVQLKFSSIQKYCLRHDGSWGLLCTLASLEILNLMKMNRQAAEDCQRLLTRKTSMNSSRQETSVHFGNVSHFHSVTVTVQKHFCQEKGYENNNSKISTTAINVKVSPMEATYSLEPINALTELCSSTQTPELVSDYQRLKSVVSSWKAQQRRKLLEVLSQREKALVVKVDVAAPVFFMHDDLSNGTLMVDLGNLAFHNIQDEGGSNYDDSWRLLLTDIQVLSLPRSEPSGKSKLSFIDHYATCHIVEPFSLDFIVYTKFGAKQWSDDESYSCITTEVFIKATLPRLVFNLSSSSVRLLHRLKSGKSITQYKGVPIERNNTSIQYNGSDHTEAKLQSDDKNGRNSIFKFEFSAPLVAVNLNNDVDGRDCIFNSHPAQNGVIVTPIAELVIQGIGGQLKHCVGSIGAENESSFVASLKSLHAKDLYQKAGKDFSMLLSSHCPESIDMKDTSMWANDSFDDQTKQFLNQISQNDLVGIIYDQSGEKRNLKIKFHELYVEWNPETLAAIQKAMRLSLEEKHLLITIAETADHFDFVEMNPLKETYYQCDSSDDDDTVFFDANELEEKTHLPSKLHLLETLSYSEDDYGYLGDLDFVDTNANQNPYSPIVTPIVLEAVRAISKREHNGTNFWTDSDDEDEQKDSEDISPIPNSTIAIIFHLSKLRVRFNKESRFRRLITAEMSETAIHYEIKPYGGIFTKAKVGNLSLTDPSHFTGSTLYGEILGIQSDVHGMASLLEIHFETFPRGDSTSKGQLQHQKEMHPRTSVCVNAEKYEANGCDNYISVHFSPMRFVLLQQLWLEIIDYFFEGVLGYEVWGRMRPDNVYNDKEKEIIDEIRECKKSNSVAGANADGVRFNLFEIVMDSPTILMPVAYRSPHHLSFDIGTIRISNKYSAKYTSCEAFDDLSYIQWYNNCNIEICEMTLSSWCGKKLSIFDEDPKTLPSKSIKPGSIPLNISMTWPTGPYVELVVPKWDIQFQMTTVRLLLRKIDFALFRNVIWYNIGEESRHLDEWNELQSLPNEELEEYKKKIMVQFGYDKKDAPPTTYQFSMNMKSIIIHLCYDVSDYVADIDCYDFIWSLVKKKDMISRQQVVCNKIHLEQTSKNLEWGRFKRLFFPLENQHNTNNDNPLSQPQLCYTSTSRPSGDNVKYLEVNDACILFIYPALMHVQCFFQDLPPPDIMHRDEVTNSLQIGDRWYRINKSGSGDDLETIQFLEESKKSEDKQKSYKFENGAEYQFRIVFVSPRIIVVDTSSLQTSRNQSSKAVTLRLGHLDFLRKIDADDSNTKALFIHDLELFTGLADDAIRRGNSRDENSLIFPISIGAGSSTHIQNRESDSLITERWFIADVLSARAAYTDMTLVIDVLQKTMSDYHAVNSISRAGKSNVVQGQKEPEEKEENRSSVNVALGGFELLVIDDSGRHFLNAQELFQVSLIGMRYNKWQGFLSIDRNESDDPESLTRLQLKGLEIIDCLQPKQSPFRLVAATKGSAPEENEATRWENMNRTMFDDFMTWEKFSMVETDWGYCQSSSLVERMNIAKLDESETNHVKSFVDINWSTYSGQRDNITFAIREIVFQWNPGLGLGLQRFLGRLKKQASEKNLLLQSSHASQTHGVVDERRFVRAELKINLLTLCLNKEDQYRRLLQVTLSDTMIVSERDHLHRLNFHGYVGDVNAWDADKNREGNKPICGTNRLVLCVLRDPVLDDDNNSCSTDGSEFENKRKHKNFLSFQYYCRSKRSLVDDLDQQALPQWVMRTVGKETSSKDIDDCLSLSVAAVRFNYLRDRSGELVDYLSNGLPGKGMGATSRAAKGFINKRIRTRSYLVVTLKAPQLLIPRNCSDEEGIMVSLGDVHVRSWFDESTLRESKAIECKDLKVQNGFSTRLHEGQRSSCDEKIWWRMLSVSFLQLGWRIHSPQRNSSSIDNPVDLHLHLRKPPSESNLPLVVRCKLSFMDLVLSFMDYVLIRSVLDENILKHVDKSLWDHIDDVQTSDLQKLQDNDNINRAVLYAANARVVRYGIMSKRTTLSNDESDLTSVSKENSSVKLADNRDESSSSVLLDLNFNLAGLNLVLHRDDPLDSQIYNSGLNYNIVSFEVDRIELAISTSESGSNPLTLKLHRLSLIDQGDVGRIARENYKGSPLGFRRPSVFSVIAESYDTFDRNASNSVLDDNGDILREPQLTLTLDTRSAADDDFGGLVEQCENSTVTVACLRLNYMNINPLMRPIKDVTDFLFCEWCTDKVAGGPPDGALANSRHAEAYNKFAPPQKNENRAVRGFQLKIVAHYPRVFLIADECDPASRALVLRGLVVLTVSVIKETMNEPDSTDGKTHISTEGQFHSLESYINPKPRHILENDILTCEDTDVLGVALIEPVTAEFHFHQVSRVNFPITRDVYINLEPVSTTLSFEDIHLIETVVSRWNFASKRDANLSRKEESKMNQSDSKEECMFFFPQSFDEDYLEISNSNASIAQTNSTDVSNTEAYCGGYLQCHGDCGAILPKEIQSTTVDAGNEYLVNFTNQTLGLALRKTGNIVVVDRIFDSHRTSQVMVGDKIISINGKSVTKLTLKAITATLADSPRPLSISFQRSPDTDDKVVYSPGEMNVNVEEDWDENLGGVEISYTEKVESVSSDSFSPHATSSMNEKSNSTLKRYPYSVSIRCGDPNGFSFESSPCGNAAIISGIQHDIFKSVLINDEMLVPKPGHVVLAIDDNPVHCMNFKQIQSILDDIKTTKTKECCKITFVELTSKDWGPVYRMDVVVSGIKLTIIDDIAGRDMPLLRWGLESIAVNVEVGLGLQCNNINVEPPSILYFDPKILDSYVISDLSETILKLCASLDTKLDYYNARIASWEPCLELCQINGDLEYQQGRPERPGALSMALSDHHISGESGRLQLSPICINLTDAAAHILISALYEWIQWRKRLRKRIVDRQFEEVEREPKTSETFCLENNSMDNRKKDGAIELKKGAVQNAAQAALIYAKRRGLDSKRADGSKPFILRNRTGMDICFVPQMQQNFKIYDESPKSYPSGKKFDLGKFVVSSITTVGNGEEASFSMDRVESDGPSSDHTHTTQNGNKIRSYDGLFPPLTVHIQCSDINTNIEIAQDLSVVKIGKKLISLHVRKKSETEISLGIIHLIWSVELERNRRIITFSSAIGLTSPTCSIPIEIGVKIFHHNSDDERESTSRIISVGFATPESDCFLPIWVDIFFKRAEVYIRPTGDNYRFKWSSENILEYRMVDREFCSSEKPQNWKWFICNSSGNTICYSDNTEEEAKIFPAYLSYEHSGEAKQITSKVKNNVSSVDDTSSVFNMYAICLSIFTSLSIRNILPESVEWEVWNDQCIIDGSSERNNNNQKGPSKKSTGQEITSMIKSGDRIEVVTCDVVSMNVRLRFRCNSEHSWTEFLTLKDFEVKDNEEPNSQQKNLEAISDCNVPLTIGVRIVPKTLAMNKGFDLILYCELWFCNLTSLPIVFGAMSNQLTLKDKNKTSIKSELTLNAENALLELSSILEFGEKGHSFISDHEKSNENGEILNLPKQQSAIITEEVFEYVEMEKGNIIKQWWAGEKYDNLRPSPLSLEASSINEIERIDKCWKIDIAGGCKAHQGGWESCVNLVGGNTKYFSPNRTFDIYHRYRRRRWFRNRKPDVADDRVNNISLNSVVGNAKVAFYQPAMYSNATGQKKLKMKRKDSFQVTQSKLESKSLLDVASEVDNTNEFKIYFKVGDGTWSQPAVVPNIGGGHGIVKMQSSRWPKITSQISLRKRLREGVDEGKMDYLYPNAQRKVKYSCGTLSSRSYELSYQISVMEGSWGEYSRLLVLYPRFILRNDSSLFDLDIKQAGAPDSSSIQVASGCSVPFYWTDSSLPELICVRPVVCDSNGKYVRCYQWSGGFDICSLGMIPLRIRKVSAFEKINIWNIKQLKMQVNDITVIRSLIEIRSGTGGTGITISFKEESPNGEDSLYRVENHSPFPLWIAQDGVLANPKYEIVSTSNSDRISSSHNISQGDKLGPGENIAFGLDVPFRQGKYAGRRAALFEELMTVRIALAPLSLRDGIETMKVVALAYVGSCFRLKPSNLRFSLHEDVLSDLMNVNVQGVVCADGPTRVLKLSLVQRNLSTSNIIRNTVRLQAMSSTISNKTEFIEDPIREELTKAAETARTFVEANTTPQSDDVDIMGDSLTKNDTSDPNDDTPNCVYSFTSFFSGFAISFIDPVPSEIAVISVKKLNFMAQWDKKRRTNAEAAISIEWLQIDNQCPSAPFPVFFSPVVNELEDCDENKNEDPFLCVGVVLAPHHKSNILCLKGISIKPRDVDISTDLAFIMRMQHFVLSIQDHFDRCEEEGRLRSHHYGTSRAWLLPDLNAKIKRKICSTNTTTSSAKLYFESLTILPFNVKLSVAPAVALSAAQATLEGPEAGAIHAAVRKGDVLLGDDTSGVLGVKIGGKNRTALAVIRGVFKSILVDSLLRFDGASMNFSGVILRNHIATTSQLKTYIGHHYLSMLKSNVPALLGSLAAFGNPVGLIRGFGDGVNDFVSEPIKGFRKSVRELDPSYAARGVARGTGSLARNTVGGIVDSASLLTESFSKSMAVLTLDRNYAQRRDRFKTQPGTSTTFVQGVESGMGKLLRGVAEGVIGAVRAPVRGAEKRGVEGFAKGVGKGLLGLVVKPVIGLSDAATDLMVGVKGSLDGVGKGGIRGSKITQIRPRRAFYGDDRSLRPYDIVDAISSAIMMRTRLAGENYLSHVDLGGRVAILGVKRFLLLGDDGQAELLVKLKNIAGVEMRQVPKQDESGMEWGVLIFLKNRKHGNDIEVITTEEKDIAIDLCAKIKQGMRFAAKG